MPRACGACSAPAKAPMGANPTPDPTYVGLKRHLSNPHARSNPMYLTERRGHDLQLRRFPRRDPAGCGRTAGAVERARTGGVGPGPHGRRPAGTRDGTLRRSGMRGNLVRRRALFDIPKDLTYFVYGDKHLVLNPEVGARCVLEPREFRVLVALAGSQADGQPAPLPETDETERTLAKLVLSWIVYFNGSKPEVDFREPPLRMVYYAITDGCNLRCPYCYASSLKCLPGELDTAESMDLVTQVAEMGTAIVVFTGGEPMLRKDLFQVAEHANRSGLRSNIITNATMIRTPEMARRIAETFNAVTVSLDGATAETHDRTRGKGSFAKTYKALQLLNAAGVVPDINHVVTSDNVDELESFATFLDGLEVNSVRLMNHNDLGRGADDNYDFRWSDHLRVQQLVWTSPAAGKLRPDNPTGVSPCSIKGNCGMGGNEIYINSLGDVYPCKLITR